MKTPIVLLARTYPFLILRFCFSVLVIVPIYYAFKIGLEVGRELLGIDFIITNLLYGYIGILAFILYISFARNFLLHFIRFSQIACVVGLLKDEVNENYLVYGFREVFRRFGTVASMYFVDKMIRRAVRSIANWISNNTSFIPDRFKTGFVSKILKGVVESVLFYVDEVIVSYLYDHKDKPVWEGSKEGISLYIKSWRGLLKSALINVLTMKVISWILNITVFILGVIVFWRDGIISVVVFYISYRIISFLVSTTLVEPYQSISMVVGFYNDSKDKEVDLELVERLEDISDEFRDLAKGKFSKLPSINETVSNVITERLSSSVSPGEAKGSPVQKILKQLFTRSDTFEDK